MIQVTHIIMVAISAFMMKNHDIYAIDSNPSIRKVLIATSILIWVALISILRHASRDFAVFVGASFKVRGNFGFVVLHQQYSS